MKVKSARVLSNTSKPSIISRRELINKSSEEANFNTGISEEVTTDVTSSWSSSHSFGEEFKVVAKIKWPAKVGVENTLSYGYTVGKGGSESKSVKVGSHESVSVTLKPGKAVKSPTDC
eukprot:UN29976